MASSVILAKTAAKVWKSFHGILCIYKPSGVTVNVCRAKLLAKMSAELNSLPSEPPVTIVDIRRISLEESKEEKKLEFGKRVIKRIPDGDGIIEVIEGPNYNDNPLVLGPRIQPQDIKLMFAGHWGMDTSGVAVCGVNRSVGVAQRIIHSRWLKTFVVSGKFGIATDDKFHTGRIISKSTYKSIKKHMVDRLLSSLQASHQQLSFEAIGVQSTSQAAYEIASKGLVRPAEDSETVLYSLKCIHFDLPNFEIEISSINETEDYIKTFIHELGIRLLSFAVCTKIRCIKYGPFTLDDALLSKHWDIQNVVDNMKRSSEILKNVDLDVRDPIVKSHGVAYKNQGE